MTDTNDTPEIDPVALAHGRKVFEINLAGARRLIAKGCPVGAVISGLLGVVNELACEAIGPRNTRAMFMRAAESNSLADQMPLDS